MKLLTNIEWMQKKADWMNPFKHIHDDILSDDDFMKILGPKESKNNSSNYGWNEPKEPEYNYWQMKNAWWKM